MGTYPESITIPLLRLFVALRTPDAHGRVYAPPAHGERARLAIAAAAFLFGKGERRAAGRRIVESVADRIYADRFGEAFDPQECGAAERHERRKIVDGVTEEIMDAAERIVFHAAVMGAAAIDRADLRDDEIPMGPGTAERFDRGML